MWSAVSQGPYCAVSMVFSMPSLSPRRDLRGFVVPPSMARCDGWGRPAADNGGSADGAARRRAVPWVPRAFRLCDHGNERKTQAEGGRRVTAQHPALSRADIDLSDIEFWGLPLTERQAAFAVLRAEEHPPFFAEPETPFAEPGPGYYALVRHADVVGASRNPEVVSSGQGAPSIPDLPMEFNEYFGSMINIDDPRHARLRRIVSRAFTPRMINKFEGDVQQVAAAIVDDLLAGGPCDFVERVAARLPLTIICQL